jgi:hypothetical protein
MPVEMLQAIDLCCFLFQAKQDAVRKEDEIQAEKLRRLQVLACEHEHP